MPCRSRGNEAGARDFVSKLFANVPVLDGGGRGATTTFTQRDTGDVLVTFENEALAIRVELGADKFDIVYPSLSIEASAPVAVVETVVDKRVPRKAATGYSSSCTARRARRSSPSTPSGRATRQSCRRMPAAFRP